MPLPVRRWEYEEAYRTVANPLACLPLSRHYSRWCSWTIEATGVRTVLGIDAAWTETQPSGVALIRGGGRSWECLAIAPSYASFADAAGGVAVDWTRPVVAGPPDVACLATAAATLAGGEVDVVAVDMPLSTVPIEGRREADRAISRAFGARGCAVHSPTVDRPGRIADSLRSEFVARGYPLATAITRSGTSPALVEVYPHTAVLVLLDAEYRVRYKIARARRYWPSLSSAERRVRILSEWRRICSALAETILGIELTLPADAASNTALKRYEDALDALVCAWVGIEYLAGRTTAYGDATAAIWTPHAR